MSWRDNEDYLSASYRHDRAERDLDRFRRDHDMPWRSEHDLRYEEQRQYEDLQRRERWARSDEQDAREHAEAEEERAMRQRHRQSEEEFYEEQYPQEEYPEQPSDDDSGEPESNSNG